tara:strand:+ start:1783 stop:2220 length:438 start_codon:yes stop_codon:yes gene_type:complete
MKNLLVLILALFVGFIFSEENIYLLKLIVSDSTPEEDKEKKKFVFHCKQIDETTNYSYREFNPELVSILIVDLEETLFTWRGEVLGGFWKGPDEAYEIWRNIISDDGIYSWTFNKSTLIFSTSEKKEEGYYFGEYKCIEAPKPLF